ncbi:hypothetical protein MYAM1_000777 [Malassezia yamatoensis]|uniref:WD40 repeat-like protein n=1 Tax=Malassezia yamatoensis TaxID=253288 RepID=A0AAJ5YQ53_9BASI|nr:hypothetical protein MYAM1_000777 [Malassezia yamatoensis]
MTDSLHVVDNCVCPAAPIGRYQSTFERKPYITHLMTPRAYQENLLGVSDSPALLLFDKHNLSTPTRTISLENSQHVTGVSDIDYDTSTWATTSSAGYVTLWDARSPKADAIRLKGPSGAPYLSIASNGPLVASGTELQGSDAYVDIWDIRNPSCPLRIYSEVHSDDIMTLTFHPDASQHPGILLSGGMDGLMSMIDTSLVAEEDAVVSVGNTDSSIAKVGFALHTAYHFQPRAKETDVDMDENEVALCREPKRNQLGPVFAISNMQTLSVSDADKMDTIVSEVSVRSPTSYRPSWVSDYVVDAGSRLPSLSPAQGIRLPLMTGDQEGGAAIISYDVLPSGSVSEWSMYARLPSSQTCPIAHSDIVRSVDWDQASQVLYTGSEDGSILAWCLDLSAPSANASLPDTLPSSPPTQGPSSGRARSTGTKKRFAPYS